MIEYYNIKDVNKWALTQRMKPDRFSACEIDDVTWYVTNYCARAVPTSYAYVKTEDTVDGLQRKLAERLLDDEMPLTDTGTMRSNGKYPVHTFRAENGTEIGVRDDHAKLIPKGGQLMAKECAKPGEALLVARVGTVAVAIFPAVKIPEEKQ